MPSVQRGLHGARPLVGWLALFGLVAVIAALRGVALLHDHSLHSIDGAMQTWFALDNFATGSQLGTEFQSYLGIVMILALLPVYLALGETLYASSMAAQLWVVIGAFVSAYATVWMIGWITPAQRWVAAIVLVFAFYLLGSLVAEAVGLVYPLSLDPGVSLRPVRGLLPFLLLPIFVLALLKAKSSSDWSGCAMAGALLGVFAGAGLLWSNDAGIPLVIALLIGLVSALFAEAKRLAAALLGYVIAGAASATAILLAVTHGDPGAWLHYNFVAVAGDQFWYFAPWDRASRVLEWSDLARIPAGGHPLSVLSLIVLTLCLAVAVILRLLGHGDAVRLSAFLFVGSSLVGTALIPQIGGHIGGEYNHITFLLGMSAPLILLPKRIAKLAGEKLAAMPTLASIFAVFAAGAILASEGARTHSIVSSSERTEFAPALGFYVTPEYAQEFAVMERLSAHWSSLGVAKERKLLSVYTSALDIAAETDSPAPVGSLIHALGLQNRSDFNALVADRHVAGVTTIAPDYSGWEGWNRRANWPFFHALRRNYHPIARNDQHIIWAFGKGQVPVDEAVCSVTSDASDRIIVRLTSGQGGLASVRLERSGTYSSERTAVLTVTEDSPFTRRTVGEPWSDFPRYGVANEAIVLLSAEVEPGKATSLTLEILDGSEIGWGSCSASVYKPIDYADLPRLPEGVAAYLSEVRR